MKLLPILDNLTVLFLDTAPIIYYVERHPRYFPLAQTVFEYVDRKLLTAVTSPITLAESLVLPYRLNLTQLQQDFFELIVHGNNTLCLSIDPALARHAAQLRAQYNLSLTDALQIASALKAGCEALLTNDSALQRITELRILVLDQMEL